MFQEFQESVVIFGVHWGKMTQDTFLLFNSMQKRIYVSWSYSTILIFQVFELGPSLYVVELRKSHGDSSLYRQVHTEYYILLPVKLVQIFIRSAPSKSAILLKCTAAVREALGWARGLQDRADYEDWFTEWRSFEPWRRSVSSIWVLIIASLCGFGHRGWGTSSFLMQF